MEPKTQSVKSLMLKAGNRTFFFDVKVASNNKRYLKITESSFVKDSDQRKYSSFLLFPEDLVNFQQRINELTSDLQSA